MTPPGITKGTDTLFTRTWGQPWSTVVEVEWKTERVYPASGKWFARFGDSTQIALLYWASRRSVLEVKRVSVEREQKERLCDSCCRVGEIVCVDSLSFHFHYVYLLPTTETIGYEPRSSFSTTWVNDIGLGIKIIQS